MIIKPRSKGYICTTAHPVGCYKNVEDMVHSAIAMKKNYEKGSKNVLVIGASSGYGLASRIISAFTYGAKTIGISFEKESSEKRTATAGYYNNQAFDQLAAEQGLPSVTLNGDAFSNETKAAAVSACKELLGNEKIDLLVYSLAAPKRIHPVTGTIHSSVIKPIGAPYTNKTVDFSSGTISEVTIQPASEDQIADTVQVMGGEDWEFWIKTLIQEDLLADGVISVAYSYIGPELTHAIYKNGTIGRAKDDLSMHCKSITEILQPVHGKALVSVNKALVTQASAAIPVVPLYISLLYKIMKQKNLHEDCFEQIRRMFMDAIYSDSNALFDSTDRIRMDDYEMRDDVQTEVAALWPLITSETIDNLTDIAGYRNEFFSLYGFGRNDVDYEIDVPEF